MNNATRIFWIHFLGCLAFLSFPVFSSPDFGQGWNLLHIAPFQRSFVRFVMLLVLFYVSYYFFIPKLYFNNKKVLFVVAVLASYSLLMAFTNLIFGDRNDFERRHLRMDFPHRPEHSEFFDSQTLIPFLLVIVLAFLIKMNNRLIEMHDEKLNAEVSYLKAQINPHFLFNTLNSLYALTLQKSNEAPNAVLKLSSIMRYVVTESAQDYVALDKELNYIKDYIDLQKLRIDKGVALTFDIEGSSLGKTIAPLILIPFIENAFKYGINPDEESFINIHIIIDAQMLQMTVKNSIVNAEISDAEKTEEGLKNTKKRLDFIYPDKHELQVKEDPKNYEIDLKIDLA